MFIQINPASSTPIYVQIMEQIKYAIASGVAKEGEQLLSVRELARQLRVNPNTISKAYRDLEREKYLITHKGKGVYIAPSTSILTQEEKERLVGEKLEAALVDGANRWQIFWRITWPQILPVSLTLVLIRMIEAFKIVDLPQVMTSGGPGTATESMTLHSFISWRTLDLGGSAAIAYMLLFVVTFIGISYVNLLRRSAVEAQ